jgi:hypothetical protein
MKKIKIRKRRTINTITPHNITPRLLRVCVHVLSKVELANLRARRTYPNFHPSLSGDAGSAMERVVKEVSVW